MCIPVLDRKTSVAGPTQYLALLKDSVRGKEESLSTSTSGELDKAFLSGARNQIGFAKFGILFFFLIQKMRRRATKAGHSGRLIRTHTGRPFLS